MTFPATVSKKMLLTYPKISKISKLNADSKQLQKVMFFDKNKEEVRQYVLALDHVNSVDVEFKPAWIQTVPPVDSHVKVVIKQVE